MNNFGYEKDVTDNKKVIELIRILQKESLNYELSKKIINLFIKLIKENKSIKQINKKNIEKIFNKYNYNLRIENDYKIEYHLNKKIYNDKENWSAMPKKIIFWKYENTIDFEYGRKGAYLPYELLKNINLQCELLNFKSEAK